MTDHGSQFLRRWPIRTAGLIAVPLGGPAGTAVAGRVDSSRTSNRFGAQASPVEQTLADTLRTYRDG